ncbi:MAG: tyrosine-type recombinase/integrase [Terracidiphilus sp.]
MKKTRKARSLTVEQFHALLEELHEPFGTLALVSVCLGLRISEALALKWGDLDWLGEQIHIQRGIVEKVVGDVKTEGSARSFPLTGELLERLKAWKQRSDFSGAEDWIFSSPIKTGRFPYSYTGVWRELVRAAEAAKIGHLGTHAFRHTYRSWLDAVGTPVAVQQKMMRHADIRTTFNIYGDVVTDEMTTAAASSASFCSTGSLVLGHSAAVLVWLAAGASHCSDRNSRPLASPRIQDVPELDLAASVRAATQLARLQNATGVQHRNGLSGCVSQQCCRVLARCDIATRIKTSDLGPCPPRAICRVLTKTDSEPPPMANCFAAERRLISALMSTPHASPSVLIRRIDYDNCNDGSPRSGDSAGYPR